MVGGKGIPRATSSLAWLLKCSSPSLQDPPQYHLLQEACQLPWEGRDWPGPQLLLLPSLLPCVLLGMCIVRLGVSRRAGWFLSLQPSWAWHIVGAQQMGADGKSLEVNTCGEGRASHRTQQPLPAPALLWSHLALPLSCSNLTLVAKVSPADCRPSKGLSGRSGTLVVVGSSEGGKALALHDVLGQGREAPSFLS